MTPAEMYERGLARMPAPRTVIPYNVEFVVSLMPTTRTGRAKVHPNQGVTINYLLAAGSPGRSLITFDSAPCARPSVL
jgi:hypothetical protein